MSELADRYRRLMAENIAGVEQARKVFAERTAVYRDRFPGDPGTADIAARDDRLRRMAIADDQYFQGLAVMYGVAALVELWRGPRP